jgi:hypothetical protein
MIESLRMEGTIHFQMNLSTQYPSLRLQTAYYGNLVSFAVPAGSMNLTWNTTNWDLSGIVLREISLGI